jgi:hypothetical protein
MGVGAVAHGDPAASHVGVVVAPSDRRRAFGQQRNVSGCVCARSQRARRGSLEVRSLRDRSLFELVQRVRIDGDVQMHLRSVIGTRYVQGLGLVEQAV